MVNCLGKFLNGYPSITSNCGQSYTLPKPFGIMEQKQKLNSLKCQLENSETEENMQVSTGSTYVEDFSETSGVRSFAPNDECYVVPQLTCSACRRLVRNLLNMAFGNRNILDRIRTFLVTMWETLVLGDCRIVNEVISYLN